MIWRLCTAEDRLKRSKYETRAWIDLDWNDVEHSHDASYQNLRNWWEDENDLTSTLNKLQSNKYTPTKTNVFTLLFWIEGRKRLNYDKKLASRLKIRSKPAKRTLECFLKYGHRS
jgi:hypothetical protein